MKPLLENLIVSSIQHFFNVDSIKHVLTYCMILAWKIRNRLGLTEYVVVTVFICFKVKRWCTNKLTIEKIDNLVQSDMYRFGSSSD